MVYYNIYYMARLILLMHQCERSLMSEFVELMLTIYCWVVWSITVQHMVFHKIIYLCKI